MTNGRHRAASVLGAGVAVALLGLAWLAARDGLAGGAAQGSLVAAGGGDPVAPDGPGAVLGPAAPRATTDAVTPDREPVDSSDDGPAPTTSERPVEPSAETDWPAGRLPVLVSTPDGRPFTALATDLGLEPQPLFASAFAVHTTLAEPTPGELPAHDATLARFHGTPGYKSYVIAERAIGSLELLAAPPMWAALVYRGVPVASLQVVASDDELRFVLAGESLEASLARATLQVVDAASGAPVTGAQATLRADSSAHRRKDLADRASDADGRVTFTNIVPGRYELQVEADGAEHQSFVVFAAGERRDLGRVPLSRLGPLTIEVVDAEGQGVRAYVEVGTHEPGRRSMEVFPQMMRHSSDDAGRAEVPRRAGPMVLRATLEIGRSNGEDRVQEVFGVRSAHAVVDGDAPETGGADRPVRLCLLTPMAVRVSTTLTAAHRLDVVDASGLVVARGPAPGLDAELVPGLHRVRVLGADGATLREVELDPALAGGRLDVH